MKSDEPIIRLFINIKLYNKVEKTASENVNQ
jgi:hypothetical protein